MEINYKMSQCEVQVNSIELGFLKLCTPCHSLRTRQTCAEIKPTVKKLKDLRRLRMAGTKDQNDEAGMSWEDCPEEILIMIFESMTAHALTMSMFVNRKWRRLALDVVKRLQLWKYIVAIAVEDKDQFKLKSIDSMNWRQIYHNHVHWHNIQRATIEVLKSCPVNNTRKLSVSGDKLVLVQKNNIEYYSVNSLTLRSSTTMQSDGYDYVENDHITVVAQNGTERSVRLIMYRNGLLPNRRLHRPDNEPKTVDNIFSYRLHKNGCYVLDKNCRLIVHYLSRDLVWKEQFIARYYGSQWSHIHISRGMVYLALQCGRLLGVNMTQRCFAEVTGIVQTSADGAQRASTIDLYSVPLHHYGFLFQGTPRFPRDKRSVEQLKEDWDLLLRSPLLSCAIVHGDILILGYKNGLIEFFWVGNLGTETQLRSIQLSQYLAKEKDINIKSLDVYEGNGFQYLFVITPTTMYQIRISHPFSARYCLKQYPYHRRLNIDVSEPLTL